MQLRVIEPGTAHVWWGRVSDARPGLSDLLSAAERDRAASFRRPIDRDRALVSYALVRLVLADYVGGDPAALVIDRTCPSCGQPHGRPRLRPSQPLNFSVSHSDNCVALAVTWGSRVGVDVERIRPEIDVAELMRQALSPQEQTNLLRLPLSEQTRGFYTWWTRKEALVKAMGRGLAIDLGGFSVTGPGEQPRLLSWPEEPEILGQVSLTALEAGLEYAACLAVIGPCDRVVSLDGSALM